MMQIFRSETIFFWKVSLCYLSSNKKCDVSRILSRSARLLQSLIPILQFHHLHLHQNVKNDMYKLLTLFTLFPLITLLNVL